MDFVGIDIGSTAVKVFVRGSREFYFTVPTGWNSKETSSAVHRMLQERGVDVSSPEVAVAATGYGRNSVRYARRVITEISCHGRGGSSLLGDRDCTILDIGGQDTKVINVKDGAVTDFLMNDKCSAGTGKFIEVMADRLGVTIDELFALAETGAVIPISSLCTVFAESEIVGHMGEGRCKEDIAAGVVDSVASKVAVLCQRIAMLDQIALTGGLSHSEYFARILSKKLKRQVIPLEMGRYAGAIGAAILTSP